MLLCTPNFETWYCGHISFARHLPLARQYRPKVIQRGARLVGWSILFLRTTKDLGDNDDRSMVRCLLFRAGKKTEAEIVFAIGNAVLTLAGNWRTEDTQSAAKLIS